MTFGQIAAGVSAGPHAPTYGFSSFTIQRGVAASPEGLLPSFQPVKSLRPGNAEAEKNNPEKAARGQTPESKSAAGKRATAAARGQDEQLQDEVLRGNAQSQQARGDYYKSVTTFADALTIARQADDPFRIAASLGGMGNAMLAAGKQSSAEKLLLEAIEVAKQTDDRSLSARLYNNLGNYYAVQEQQDKALSAYQNSASLLAKSTLPKAAQALETAKVYANIARIHLYLGSHKRALQALAQAETATRSALQNEEYTSVLIHLAKSHEQIAVTRAEQKRHSLLAAHALLQRAAKRGRAQDDQRLLSYALGNLGALYQLEERLNEALVLTRQALAAAEQAGAAESIYRWHWQEGQLLRKQGDQQASIQAYRRAVQVIDSSRQATVARYDSAEDYFKQLVAPVYMELVDALLQAEDSAKEAAAAQPLLIEARATIEKFKTAELKNYFYDDCVLDFAAEQKPLDAVSPSTAIVYPIVLPDRIELLVSLPAAAAPGKPTLQRYAVQVSAEDLARHVQKLRDSMEQMHEQDALLSESQWLYQRLVQPYIEELEDMPVDTLVFVPTGVLRMVPFAALHDGKQFIVRDYALATTSGLSLPNPQPLLAKRKHKVLLSGISDALRGYPALNFVPGELETIKTLFGGDVLLNEDFTSGGFEQKVRDTDYSIIHIASHAQFTGKAGGNFLQAFDKPMYLDEFNAALSITKYRERPLELLVLSACQTASGDERAALGLAGVGIKAGARSALGSLWSVADESAAALITDFYRNLGTEDTSKAEALQQAQVALLDSKRFAHPFHWSAFLLIDNWL